MRVRPLAGGLLGMLALLALGWVAGFAWFVHGVSGADPGPPPQADGIVVFTGGADRVETALRLLAAHHGRVLLISGVGGSAPLTDLARRAGADTELLDVLNARGGSQVTLGRAATTTRGNAAETADWAARNGVHSLIVVTAAYHMPRALAELSRALPGCVLYPVPVQPPALRGGTDAATLRLLAAEYTKWLATEAGLSRLAATPDATRIGG